MPYDKEGQQYNIDNKQRGSNSTEEETIPGAMCMGLNIHLARLCSPAAHFSSPLPDALLMLERASSSLLASP